MIWVGGNLQTLTWVGDNLQTISEHLKKAWISVWKSRPESGRVAIGFQVHFDLRVSEKVFRALRDR
jgi:hypothetical protein